MSSTEEWDERYCELSLDEARDEIERLTARVKELAAALKKMCEEAEEDARNWALCTEPRTGLTLDEWRAKFPAGGRQALGDDPTP